jgi:hypothetical protein
MRRSFAPLRMTANGLGMTAWRGFSATCEAPPFQTGGEKFGLEVAEKIYRHVILSLTERGSADLIS